MVVDRRLIDARFGDDRPNARAVIAPLGEQGDRSLQDVVARIFGRARHLHPSKNSNNRLNSAYARLRADAIADPLWRPRHIFFPPSYRSFFGHKRMFEFQMIV
jgi:hypothetical protein